jgi:hypothetical protein
VGIVDIECPFSCQVLSGAEPEVTGGGTPSHISEFNFGRRNTRRTTDKFKTRKSSKDRKSSSAKTKKRKMSAKARRARDRQRTEQQKLESKQKSKKDYDEKEPGQNLEEISETQKDRRDSENPIDSTKKSEQRDNIELWESIDDDELPD